MPRPHEMSLRWPKEKKKRKGAGGVLLQVIYFHLVGKLVHVHTERSALASNTAIILCATLWGTVSPEGHNIYIHLKK